MIQTIEYLSIQTKEEKLPDGKKLILKNERTGRIIQREIYRLSRSGSPAA